MNMFRQIVKQTKYRFRDSKFTTIFLTLSFLMSMILISIGTSFVTQYLRAQQAKEQAMPPNGCQVGFYREDEVIDIDTIYKMLGTLGTDEGVILNEILMQIDGNVHSYSPVSAEYFHNDEGWHYPVISGRYYTKEEIQQGKKVMLVGQSLFKQTENVKGKNYLTVEGERYEVIGVVGLKDQISLWDNRIFLPATALPAKILEEYSSGSAISMILYNSNGGIESALERMEEEGKKGMSDLVYDNYGPVGIENVLEDILNNADNIFFLAILGYLLTLIYSINIVRFWIIKRKYEIGVRKAFGYTNKNVVGILMEEMLGIMGISFVAAVTLQLVLRITIGSLFRYTLQLYIENLLVGFVVVAITSMVVALCSIRKILRISPAVVLKEGNSNA